MGDLAYNDRFTIPDDSGETGHGGFNPGGGSTSYKVDAVGDAQDGGKRLIQTGNGTQTIGSDVTFYFEDKSVVDKVEVGDQGTLHRGDGTKIDVNVEQKIQIDHKLELNTI